MTEPTTNAPADRIENIVIQGFDFVLVFRSQRWETRDTKGHRVLAGPLMKSRTKTVETLEALVTAYGVAAISRALIATVPTTSVEALLIQGNAAPLVVPPKALPKAEIVTPPVSPVKTVSSILDRPVKSQEVKKEAAPPPMEKVSPANKSGKTQITIENWLEEPVVIVYNREKRVIQIYPDVFVNPNCKRIRARETAFARSDKKHTKDLVDSIVVPVE